MTETQANRKRRPEFTFDYELPAATPVPPSPRPEAAWYRRARLRTRPAAVAVTVDEPTVLPPFYRYGPMVPPPDDDAPAEAFDEWIRAALVYSASFKYHTSHTGQ